jgi:hypothetical protein
MARQRPSGHCFLVERRAWAWGTPCVRVCVRACGTVLSHLDLLLEEAHEDDCQAIGNAHHDQAGLGAAATGQPAGQPGVQGQAGHVM